MSAKTADGLDGVVVAETILSEVDGEAGRLVIRGYPVEALCGAVSFEAVVRLLWDGFFDRLPQDLTAEMGKARAEVFDEVRHLDLDLAAAPPVDAMRALIARLPDGDDLADALRLVVAPGVFLPAAVRAQAGLAPVAPDPAASHAWDALRMISGVEPRPGHAAALDAYLTTVSDHGLNASTFAARVVASTRAGLTSSVLAGIGALKGPLHGGAPGPVIEMLDAIAAAGDARAWLEAALDRGDRLMGFGHRVYRVRDPRADALKAVVRRLAEGDNLPSGRLALAERVESAALAVLKVRRPQRSLDTNVELYTALLLEALGFGPTTFTGVFAMGRVAGWIAHAREQRAGGRIIRPQSRYVGPMLQAA